MAGVAILNSRGPMYCDRDTKILLPVGTFQRLLAEIFRAPAYRWILSSFILLFK